MKSNSLTFLNHQVLIFNDDQSGVFTSAVIQWRHNTGHCSALLTWICALSIQVPQYQHYNTSTTLPALQYKRHNTSGQENIKLLWCCSQVHLYNSQYWFCWFKQYTLTSVVKRQLDNLLSWWILINGIFCPLLVPSIDWCQQGYPSHQATKHLLSLQELTPTYRIVTQCMHIV